jgi:xanthine dehydrogenase accessory factor
LYIDVGFFAMKELKAIVNAYHQIDFSMRKAALATVVKVRGSSYRSPGARMIITDDGKWIGSISGGCLEGDALRKARQVMIDKNPITVTYDTTEDSNQNLGIGLGCNGIIDVLIEPIDPLDENNPVKQFERLLTINEPVASATVFTSKAAGKKIFKISSGFIFDTVTEDSLRADIDIEFEGIFNTGKSTVKTFLRLGEEVEVFFELIQPSIKLIIFGGGFDARPVSDLAKTMGWNVEVTDECVAHIAPVFFPKADKLSLCQREFIERNFEITPYTACVLMSHNYEYDRGVLNKILKSPSPYIGILGPRKRFEKMISELNKKGIHLSNNDHHRIHSPIGLDIGAETPDEIALSIIGEVQSKFSNRSGGFLKYRNAPIHQRDMKTDQVFKQIFLNDEVSAKRTASNP